LVDSEKKERRLVIQETRVDSGNVHDVQKGLVSASGVQQARRKIEQPKDQTKERNE